MYPAASIRLAKIDAVPDPEAMTCEVWIVAGRADPVVSFEYQAALALRLPHGRLFALEGCGHLAFAEREREFDELLLAFARG